MVNNVGKTSKKLDTELGRQTTYDTGDEIEIISGELGLGFLVFDPDGTVGVITNFINENNFMVTTHAISIDIEKILNLSY